MRRIAAFLKATTVGGLFVLLPVAAVFILLTKTVVAARSVTMTLMETFAGRESVAAEFPMVYAVLIVVVISFIFGLVMISHLGRSVGTWIERTLLFRIPGYAAARAIIGGLANAEREGVVKSGVLKVGEGAECFVFITEDHGDGKLTIFIPGTPNPGTGTVQIVSKELVRPLHVRITNIAHALQQWGVGSAKLLVRHDHPWKGQSQAGDAPVHAS